MRSTAEIDRLVAAFVAGQPFWEFWQAFMAFYESFDDSTLPPEQQARFAELYELVYMGQPESTTDEERRVGLLGERELRERLRHFRMVGDVSAPA